jgi:hypothetical protein
MDAERRHGRADAPAVATTPTIDHRERFWDRAKKKSRRTIFDFFLGRSGIFTITDKHCRC